MSLSRFLEEAHAALRADSSLQSKDALELVRDRWLQEKKYEGLVGAVLANLTSGNCVAFMKPLSEALVRCGEQSLHRKLWAKTIKRQIASAFDSYAHLKASKPTFEEVIHVDFHDFNEFDFNEYDDRKKATAFLMNRLLESLQLWREELRSRAWNEDEIDLLVDQIRSLKKPRISVS